ncbi:hypothetical protein QBC40DRAFT_181479 [Triangularia verruculosa]|uniref:Uncharacterized protein n=1 Tax=Triangularia verruculosa TaxID=2587418 RepID=A0AAN6XD60_9PEZI|nr:hypothetical protein QBC40DRAFT_181479 [Triangularia verruculosa]
MLSLITLATSALALFGLARGAIPDATWNLPINLTDPNSPTVSVTGTIQMAVAQMEADYPGWNATFMALEPRPSDDNRKDDEPEPNIVYKCNTSEAMAYKADIKEGIKYLRKVPGTAKNGAGPDNCGRVSCSYNSAIIWCNQDDEEKELQWYQIADAAQYTYYYCLFDIHVIYVRGHGDYVDDKWGVIIRKEYC